MAIQQPHSSSAVRQHPIPQQHPASRKEFLWRRKLDLEEQTLDTTARLKALQEKLAQIEEQKQSFKRELTTLKHTQQKRMLVLHMPIVALLVRRPSTDLRLLEAQVRRLVEEEMKTKADRSLAQHALESLHAKVAHLDFELSLL